MNNLRKSNIGKIITVVLTVWGLIGFTLFILEESFQTIMFGTWPAQDAQAWDHVLVGVDLMEYNHRISRGVLYSIGWLNPLAFISYREYLKSEAYYIQSLKLKTLAHAPEAFVGRRVTFTFTADQVYREQKGSRLVSRGVTVLIDRDVELGSKVEVSGQVNNINGVITIRSEL